MSIHEVIYDSQGRIVRAKSLDDRIRLAGNKFVEVLVEEYGSPVKIDYRKLPELVETTQLSSDPRETYPYRHRTFRALTPDSIVEIDHVVGHDVTNGQKKEDKIAVIEHKPDRLYLGRQINEASIRVGRVGYVWTEKGKPVDIYVAPQQQTGLIEKIKGLIKR